MIARSAAPAPTANESQDAVDINVVTGVLVDEWRVVVDGLVVVSVVVHWPLMGLIAAFINMGTFVVLDLVVGVRGPVMSAVWLVFCIASISVVVSIEVGIAAIPVGAVCTVSVAAVAMMSSIVVAINATVAKVAEMTA